MCVCKAWSLSVFEKWGNSIPFICSPFFFFHVDSKFAFFVFVFAFFSLVFVNHFFFVFFSRALCSFLLHQPLTLRLKKSLLSPWYVPSLSFRGFSLSLSLFSREEEEEEYESHSKVPSLRPVVFRAREMSVVFFNALRFFCKFWCEEKALSPTKNECVILKRKRRKSREFTLARPRFSRNFTDFTVSLT